MTGSIKRVVLEMSLKPFKETGREYIQEVCQEVLRQWDPLLKDSGEFSVLLWVAEGSDILEWNGDYEKPLEWARYIGYLNDEYNRADRVNNPVSGRYYTEYPAKITYGILRIIIGTLKEAALKKYGRKLTVGATFDLGPEFARSEFKYKLHPEITLTEIDGNELALTKGCKMVCCWSKLHGDRVRYAGFENGIPEGTSFGKFLGRQSKEYMMAMGFDYIWFSNGFGFSCMPWTYLGVNYDGRSFNNAKFAEVRDKILSFWRDFKQECSYPVEARGTNMSTGIDLATDLTPARDLYENRFFDFPPPNSPWGALDNDFGLEMVGYMSRIAKLPGECFIFRYYPNDPWYWQNPWWDNYDREPFDIYCPMSVGRLDRSGKIQNPSTVEFLTIDTEKGELNENCPGEIIPHIKRAVEFFPDQAGIITWLYPFDEYHDMAEKHNDMVNTLFFGDWFVRNAINNGLPLNTVVSTDAFAALRKAGNTDIRDTIVFTPSTVLEGTYEKGLESFLKEGGKVILYGPVTNQTLKDLLNLDTAEGLEGEFTINTSLPCDVVVDNPSGEMLIKHEALVSGGALCDRLKNGSDRYTLVRATASQGNEMRIYALTRKLPEWNGGILCWVRGTLPFNTSSLSDDAVSLPARQPDMYSDSSVLVRYILSDLGYCFKQYKNSANSRETMTFISRHDNAFIFSGCKYDTTVVLEYAFPQGAPLVIGRDAAIRGGSATYYLDKSFYKECRIFLQQDAVGTVSCREVAPRPTVKKYTKRRICVKGLVDATLTVYPPLDALKGGLVEFNNSESLPGSLYDEKEYLIKRKIYEDHIVLTGISGCLEVSW